MFGKIAAFELRYQLRQPLFWITSLIFFLLVFGSIVVDQITIGSGGNIHKNSPTAIARISLIMGVFFMFASTAFVANAIVRDDETGFGPIVPEKFNVTNVQLLNIRVLHPNTGDLLVTLRAPDGTTITPITGICSGAKNGSRARR